MHKDIGRGGKVVQAPINATAFPCCVRKDRCCWKYVVERPGLRTWLPAWLGLFASFSVAHSWDFTKPSIYVHVCTACMGVGCLCICKYVHCMYVYTHDTCLFPSEVDRIKSATDHPESAGLLPLLPSFLPSEQWSPTASLTCVLKCGWVWVGVAMGW